jgi:hypothetical protein
MRRLTIFALVALLAAVGVASAGWNLKQKDDGRAVWERTLDNSERIEFSAEGNVWSPNNVVYFDDFLGDLIRDEWDGQSGSDAQALNPSVSGIDGTVVMVGGNAGTGVAADNSMLGLALNFEADNGGLFIEAKCKLSAITNVIVNIGFTDVAPSTTEELPLEYNTTTITSTASNAVAAVFDTGATTDNWHLIGVKANTDTAAVNTGLAPVADTYQTFKLVVNASGNAGLYINGALVASVDNAVTVTTDLTPILIIVPDTTTSVTMTCDYVMVGMNRS